MHDLVFEEGDGEPLGRGDVHLAESLPVTPDT